MKYAFIQQQGQHHPLRRLCQVLGVSTSGYYDWLLRPESNRAKSNRRLLTKIQCFHKASRGIYGSPRIHQDLLSCGEQVGIHRVARLMKKADIQSRMARKFVITTNSKNTLAPAPDRVERQFYSQRKNQTWVSDTTFIATRQGWLYLAIVLDLFSRQVIGWAMGDQNNRQLVINALTIQGETEAKRDTHHFKKNQKNNRRRQKRWVSHIGPPYWPVTFVWGSDAPGRK